VCVGGCVSPMHVTDSGFVIAAKSSNSSRAAALSAIGCQDVGSVRLRPSAWPSTLPMYNVQFLAGVPLRSGHPMSSPVEMLAG